MTDNTTPEERIDLAAQARLEVIREDRLNEEALARAQANSSLSALGWIAGAGLALTIVAMIVIGSSSSPGPLAMLFWPAMLTVGPTVGFIALITYLAVKAVLTGK